MSGSNPRPVVAVAEHTVKRPTKLGLVARLRAYFLAGVLVTAPIAITFYLSWQFITFIDGSVTAVLPAAYSPTALLPFTIPGLGVVFVVVTLTLVGAFAAGYVGRVLLRLSEAMVARMPVIRGIYSATKQMAETVLANKSKAFREVVLLEFPRSGTWTLGFITGHTFPVVEQVTGRAMANVFVPTTPNPTSGYLLFIPREELVILDMSVEDGLKMIVSGGIVMPPERPKPVELPVP